MDFKFCLLAPCSDRVTRTCPKVIISRLIGDDGGNRGKKPVTQRPESHNFQANTSDDGGRNDAKTPGNSV